MNNEFGIVKTFFTSIQVHLSDIWLESCINWCKSEVLNANYTIKELQSKVYEQWLITDLRDVEVPCLPPNLSSQKYFTLNGNFCLQMMQVVDISKPKLWQLQKIRNSNALTRATQQDGDTVGTGKRLLQLTLTDGVQEVEAMEYRPVPSLNLNLSPGIKVRIMGPVIVRRGRLMLEQQNVKVLGGEVEDILVSHAAENVLARFLKLPENPNPVVIEEKNLSVEEEEDKGPKNSMKVSKPPPKSVLQTVPVVCTVTDEEDIMLAKEVDLLLEAERDLSQPKENKSRTPDLFEDEFNVDDFNEIDSITTSTQVCQSQPKVQKDLAQSLMDDDNDDVFNDIDIDAHLDEFDKKSEETPLCSNVVTIVKLLEKMGNINRGTFKIKAKFKSVVEKLTIGSDEYKLVIQIEDDTGDLTVKMHSDIIADFTGYSPAAILSLKSSILDDDKSAVEKVMQ
ncbi:recQ-mediated genome instability protein 1-like, partial [Asbolus verrucosus]